MARWEGPWRAVAVAAAAGDDAGGIETRDEDCGVDGDRGDSSCGRAAAGAAGLRNTVASFCCLFDYSVPLLFFSVLNMAVFCVWFLLLGR